VSEQRIALRDARFAATGAGQRDLKKIREAKQQIAWALTELNARRNQPATNK
jgi:ribosomal protein L29